MLAEGWKDLILRAANDSPKMVDNLAKYLAEVDIARQILRDKGFGVTGTPIIEQVKEVPMSVEKCPDCGAIETLVCRDCLRKYG